MLVRFGRQSHAILLRTERRWSFEIQFDVFVLGTQ